MGSSPLQIERDRLDSSRLAGKATITVERSHDYAAIRALLQHPRVFPHISDDFTGQVWEVPKNDLIVYLLASDGDGPFGFGIFIPRTNIIFEGHIAFLPRSYGAQAARAFKEILAWMWANTAARRIVGELVRSNTLALRFVRRAGMDIYGINKKSCLRGGVLHDLVCVGISKP